VWHDLECGSYTADLPLWREMVATARARSTDDSCAVLEIGCGTGRVSLALAADGFRVTAVDIEPELIDVLRRRARERGAPIEAMVADARGLDLDRSFDVILAPMQFVQLFGAADRLAVLSCIARHLRLDGHAALALLDLDEEWDASDGPLPPPDTIVRKGFVYSSQPVAVRRIAGTTTLRLDTLRRTVPPGGRPTETLSRVCLDLISAAQLEVEARPAGLVPHARRRVPETRDHVASRVIVLQHAHG
jgi:SAM-dependent methyltransferase